MINNMVAPSSDGLTVAMGHAESVDDDHGINAALFNSSFSPPASKAQIVPPEQCWDGTRETLTSWYEELYSTLSFISPSLCELIFVTI